MSLKVHKLAATSDVIALRNYGPGHLMALNLHMCHGYKYCLVRANGDSTCRKLHNLREETD